MKVKDLIKILQDFDGESVVISHSDNFELNGSLTPISYVHLYPHGEMKMGHFRDAFDGFQYTHEVYQISGGSLPVVVIS